MCFLLTHMASKYVYPLHSQMSIWSWRLYCRLWIITAGTIGNQLCSSESICYFLVIWRSTHTNAAISFDQLSTQESSSKKIRKNISASRKWWQKAVVQYSIAIHVSSVDVFCMLTAGKWRHGRTMSSGSSLHHYWPKWLSNMVWHIDTTLATGSSSWHSRKRRFKNSPGSSFHFKTDFATTRSATCSSVKDSTCSLFSWLTLLPFYDSSFGPATKIASVGKL